MIFILNYFPTWLKAKQGIQSCLTFCLFPRCRCERSLLFLLLVTNFHFRIILTNDLKTMKWYFFLLLTNLLSKLSRFFIALPLQDLCWIKRFAFFHLSRINFFIVRIFCVSFSRPCKMQIHWWWKKKICFPYIDTLTDISKQNQLTPQPSSLQVISALSSLSSQTLIWRCTSSKQLRKTNNALILIEPCRSHQYWAFTSFRNLMIIFV